MDFSNNELIACVIFLTKYYESHIQPLTYEEINDICQEIIQKYEVSVCDYIDEFLEDDETKCFIEKLIS